MKKEEGSEPSEALKSEVTHKDYFKSMTQLFTYTKKVQVVRKKKTNCNVLLLYRMAVILKKFHVTLTHYNDSVLLNIVKSKDLEISIYGAKSNQPIKHVDTSGNNR